MSQDNPLRVGSVEFLPGQCGVVDLPVGSLTGYQPVTMHVHVRRGRQPGPVLLLTAGLHGDELIGVEILRRLLQMRNLRSIKGTLLVVPVVCMPAFLARSRYLPDRRDLNRLFPGSPEGSLGSRLAHAFVQEIVPHATHSIDFHGGAVGRPNLPQIRVSPGDPIAADLARAFAPPVVIETGLREGSLRAFLKSKDIPSLLFEGGEAFRISKEAVRVGLRGVCGVMRRLGMLPSLKSDEKASAATLFARSTSWVRAPRGDFSSPRPILARRCKPGPVSAPSPIPSVATRRRSTARSKASSSESVARRMPTRAMRSFIWPACREDRKRPVRAMRSSSIAIRWSEVQHRNHVIVEASSACSHSGS